MGCLSSFWRCPVLNWISTYEGQQQSHPHLYCQQCLSKHQCRLHGLYRRALSISRPPPHPTRTGTTIRTTFPSPTALPRTDFLSPSFDAASYLSSLSDRHQTLEDLRQDLRDRSAAISTELLELVNANYTSFLSLGSELKGGEERVEDVRVGLLGFRRAIEEVKGRVGDRGQEIQGLNTELGGVRGEIEKGRRMLELSDRLELLEGRLALDGAEIDSDDSEEDEDEDDSQIVGSSATKLATLARDYTTVQALADDIGRDTPYVKKLAERIAKCRTTILLDLGTTIKAAKKAGASGQEKLLKLMAIYAMLDAQKDAIKALKGA
ncbi:hypothetical protein PG993_014057 [Apiospora rasikravindrae]|uniref:Conserved oligomeric Golgi complex subunit 2 n=1 Tax=Apiospora rasikravindrae TaxID=990691 RepID=A0ABR1RRZ6_9PEZI